MNVIQCDLPGLLLVQKTVYEDERGSFMELYNQQKWAEKGQSLQFVQDNVSVSKKGTLRGLHYQKQHPQGKLVSVLSGEIYDVAVDIRKDSATFGQWRGFLLSDRNHNQLFIPAGFAHGFLCLSERAIVHYKTTEGYYPNDEGGIAWNDPRLDIAWPVQRMQGVLQPQLQDGTPLTLSEKDKRAGSLDEYIRSWNK